MVIQKQIKFKKKLENKLWKVVSEFSSFVGNPVTYMDIVYCINCKGFMDIYANINARNLKSAKIF